METGEVQGKRAPARHIRGDWISVPAAGDLLGRGRTSVYTLIKQGLLKQHRVIGLRHPRISRTEVLRLIEMSEAPASAPTETPSAN